MATDLAEVTSVLETAEHWARQGSWVVCLVSYEAAPAFDTALVTHRAGPLPLAWVGAFDTADLGGPELAGPAGVGPWSGLDQADHRMAFDRIRAHIRDGDTYQVNHSVRLRATFTGDPVDLFTTLSRAQATPYSVYLDLGRFVIASVSPELFVQRIGHRLRVAPMKGTAARLRDPGLDLAASAALRRSAKDVAENIMIVDLLRNDLARVSQPGSVRVHELCAVETLPTLHTMVSTIDADAQEGLDLVALFGAVFPCGSITGAPKVSTMRIIRELETSPRGVYCGALGLLAPGGDATFTVPIRTAVIDTHTGEVEYSVGSGITYASDAQVEFAELSTKARVLDALTAERGSNR